MNRTQILIIPLFIEEVVLSEARQKKYYEKGKRMPKAEKYSDKTKYFWSTYNSVKDRLFLFSKETGERVLANPKAAGTPRVSGINGQHIYSGKIREHTRATLMRAIKNSFKPYISQLSPINFPIKITLEMHTVIGLGNWDLDNKSMPYIKAFQDCLTGNKKLGVASNKVIIEDDNVLYITRPPAPIIIPVADSSLRKLVFIIEPETDLRILESVEYKEKWNL